MLKGRVHRLSLAWPPGCCTGVSVGQGGFVSLKKLGCKPAGKDMIIYLCQSLKCEINYVILLQILAITWRFIIFLTKTFCLHVGLGDGL